MLVPTSMTSESPRVAGWLAKSRAIHASRMAPSDLHDLMPDIAASWAANEESLELPEGCTGLKYGLQWYTSSFFDDEDIKDRLRFDEVNHEWMRDDQRRTPLYYAAIRKRLAAADAPLVVLDLGTGPYALLALEAARAGAQKVYAIEADQKNAKLAVEAVSAAGYAEVVEVVCGISTRVTLPEKVDLLISEVIGSVASEEGVYATIADAHARHVKRPTEASSWIPHRCQTWGAPASYSVHFALGRPDYEWRAGAACRVACEEPALQILSKPQLVEDIDFTDPALPTDGTHRLTPEPVTFVFDEQLMGANAAGYERDGTTAAVREGREEDAEEEAEVRADAAAFAAGASRSLSGIALWPRLELDPADETLAVEARGSEGEPQPSSWHVLLPILAERPLPIEPGESVTMALSIQLEEGVESGPRYVMEGELKK